MAYNSLCLPFARPARPSAAGTDAGSQMDGAASDGFRWLQNRSRGARSLAVQGTQAAEREKTPAENMAAARKHAAAFHGDDKKAGAILVAPARSFLSWPLLEGLGERVACHVGNRTASLITLDTSLHTSVRAGYCWEGEREGREGFLLR
ncbi:hypothetical protein SKAU_G00402030 [Synaphobranchus kaupii]|uniref:Uncharacterized protein n=1 Tax=Synaphobranchus kaupii TaxID=118154 RepID=A0A9Q1E967_SYNKA|nr:hypothetical protein SKAU_G00402030 [Synaphobranchus kaupii]